MGSSESTLSSSQPVDEITTVSERPEGGVNPLLERLKSLKVTTPILTSIPTENSLTDILVRKPPASSVPGTLDPKVLLELFSMYRDWQEQKTKKISQRQEEIENKIEVADALAVKLLQRFNYSVSAMRTTAHHLSKGRVDSIPLGYLLDAILALKRTIVHPLQVEVGELKGRLTEVISNCDALCKRIAAEGPESIRLSIEPFSAGSGVLESNQHSSSLQKVITTSSSTT